MKIVIKNHTGQEKIFRLPDSLAFHRLSVNFIARLLQKKQISITEIQLYELFNMVKRYKRVNESWVLLEIHSQNHGQIEISL